MRIKQFALYGTLNFTIILFLRINGSDIIDPTQNVVKMFSVEKLVIHSLSSEKRQQI